MTSIRDEQEPLKAAPSLRAEPILQRVEWLMDLIDLDSRQHAYEIISSGLIRPDCVVRIGRRVRLHIANTLKWIDEGCPDHRLIKEEARR